MSASAFWIFNAQYTIYHKRNLNIVVILLQSIYLSCLSFYTALLLIVMHKLDCSTTVQHGVRIYTVNCLSIFEGSVISFLCELFATIVLAGHVLKQRIIEELSFILLYVTFGEPCLYVSVIISARHVRLFFRLDTGAVVSWLSEGAELHETKDETGKLTRQEFHQRTISTTISTVTTLTKTTASHDDAPTSEESAGTHQGERAVSAVLAAQTESGSYKQKLEGKDSKRAGKMAVNDRRTTFCDAGGEGTHNRSEPRQVAQKQYKASDEVYHCSSSEQYQLQVSN